MDQLAFVLLAGFLAAIVDGALGMGFGPTSSSILLSSGLSPAATSTTVNIAKVVTGVASGISHWRFANVDRRLVLRLAGPGVAGAAIGATILARVDGAAIRPWLAIMLVVVGLRILVRFSAPVASAGGDGGMSAGPGAEGGAVLACAGVGGVTNGLVGAWGPVVTPFLMHRRVPPRLAVGSVNTAEVAVAVVSAGSLLAGSQGAGLDAGIVVAMLAGGVIGAPLAARVIRYIPARTLGLACAGLLLVTQVDLLAGDGYLPVGRRAAMAAAIALVVAAAWGPALLARGRGRRSGAIAVPGVPGAISAAPTSPDPRPGGAPRPAADR